MNTEQEEGSQHQQIQKESQSEELEQMTPQLALELVELMKSPKIEIKYGTINAILQHTKSQTGKLLFLETDLFKLIVEIMENTQLHKICLSTLIHFSSSQNCAKKIITFIEPIIMDLQASEGLIEELGLLLLLNLSKVEEFTQKLAKLNEEGNNKTVSETPSSLLQIIFSLMDKKPSRRWVIANIFVNVSSFNVGREYIAKQKLYLQFLKHINDSTESLRLAVLRVIRNVAFLWENEEIVTEMLKKENHLIDNIAIHILIMIIKSKLIQNWQNTVQLLRESNYNNLLDYDMQIEPDLPNLNTTNERSVNEIEICIDIILILSNSDFSVRKPQFLKFEFQKTIEITKLTEITEESKDKLLVLENFCFL